LLIVFWQVPLLVIAVIKSRKTFGYIVPLQLYVLLNIYFLARGSAFIRIHEG